MTIHIIEPGLVARTGHYFDYCLAMASALQARGRQVCVHGQAGGAADVGAALAAAGVPYRATVPPALQVLPRRGADGRPELGPWLRQTRPWLLSLLQESPPDAADLWLFPTLQTATLLALSTLPASPALVGLVHTPPIAAPWLQAATILKQSGRSCCLLAIDPQVAAMTAELSAGLPVAAAPVPHGRWTRREPRDTVDHVGFFGNQRDERGQALLGPLVHELLARGLQVTVHDSRARMAVRVPAPGLTIVPGFVDDLGELIARCDLVLCPMVRDAYRHRISGIATQAIASGVPVVLPGGTLTAQRWQDAGGLMAYEQDTVDDILRCVDHVRDNAALFARQAQAGALAWAAQHGLERFIDAVLAPA